VAPLGPQVFRIDRSIEDRSRCVVSFSFQDPSKREVTEVDEHAKKLLLERNLIPEFSDRLDGGINVRLPVAKGTHLYGCGEMYGDLLRNGIEMDLWSRDAYRYQYPLGKPATGLYQNHPWVLTLTDKGESFGFLWDSSYHIEIDLRDDEIVMRQDPHGPPAPVIIILGPNPRKVVATLYSLIGNIPMPPLWALGYHQCRFSYYSQRHVLHVAQEFRRTKMPCDSIWCDIHYMNDFRIFTWNPKNFPDPKGMCDELHKMNFHCLAMSDPAPKVERGYSVYDTGINYSSKLPSPLIRPIPLTPAETSTPPPTASSVTEDMSTPSSPSTNSPKGSYQWAGYDPNINYGGSDDEEDEEAEERKAQLIEEMGKNKDEGGVNIFTLNKKGEEYHGDMWPGVSAWPDYTMKACREWWARLLAEFLDTSGVDTVWNDVNEPTVFNAHRWTMPTSNIHRADEEYGGTSDHNRFHNLYGAFMGKATWDGLLKCRPKQRPFFLNRAGFIGSQRYGGTWNGDNLSTWEHLALTIPIVLNFALSGQPFSGPDIGGYCGAEKLNRLEDGELMARWMGIGSLLPFCRTQTEDKCDFPREPYCFPEHEKTIRAALTRRYRLLPYLYTLFYFSHSNADLIVSPLWYSDFTNLHVRNNLDSFLMGDSLLVKCDIYKERKDGKKKVPSGDIESLRDLPSGFDDGRWVPFDLDNIDIQHEKPYLKEKEKIFTKEEVKKKKDHHHHHSHHSHQSHPHPHHSHHHEERKIDTHTGPTLFHDTELPLLFLKRGSIIFVGPPMEYVNQKRLDPLILAICLDTQGKAQGILYEDSGDGWEYQKEDDYLMTTYSAEVISVSDSASEVKVSSQTKGKRTRPERKVIMKFYTLQKKETKQESGRTSGEKEQQNICYNEKFSLRVFQASGKDGQDLTIKLPIRITCSSESDNSHTEVSK
jgi:alpha-glucosidase (family GH31 glycosyl hydrolase)